MCKTLCAATALVLSLALFADRSASQQKPPQERVADQAEQQEHGRQDEQVGRGPVTPQEALGRFEPRPGRQWLRRHLGPARLGERGCHE